jgi:hypothetical protein
MHAGIKMLLEKSRLAADEIDEIFIDGVSGT